MTTKYFFFDRDGSLHTRTSTSGRTYTHAVVVKFKDSEPDQYGHPRRSYKPTAQYAGRPDLAHKVASQYVGGERIEWVDIYPVQVGKPPKAAPVVVTLTAVPMRGSSY